MAIYDLVWKRDQPLPDVFQTETIPKKLRSQVFWLWNDTLKKFDQDDDGWAARQNIQLRRVWEAVCREHGVQRLSNNPFARPEDDIEDALLNGNDTQVALSIIELSMRLLCVLSQNPFSPDVVKKTISELNHRFRENGVGYQFDINTLNLIPINAPLVHENVVRPALALLAHPDLATANQEYLEAWEDFKNSDYNGCILECGKAFESVMKIICTKKGWTFNQTDTAKPLMETIIRESGMPPFFKDPLMLIATMRNKFSAHGAGAAPTNVPIHIARYALNATASAILLLVEATGV
jgi:hypothetical protein